MLINYMHYLAVVVLAVFIISEKKLHYMDGDSTTNHVITVTGQKPTLDNSIDGDWITYYTNDIIGAVTSLK